ncbi:MAG: hypothetical protein ACC742_16305, partial [Thermoanaerobaculales bacterium]
MRKAVTLVLILAAVWMLGVNSGGAGVLATDPAAMGAWQGTRLFDQTVFTVNLKANVDYAVYAPGSFSNSAVLGNPADPSNGSQYVYAYQVLNDQDGNRPVTQLSVGFLDMPPEGNSIDDAEVPENIGFVDGFASLDVDPDSSFNPDNDALTTKQAANWAFAGTGLEPGTSDLSDILIYTSPHGPEWDAG